MTSGILAPNKDRSLFHFIHSLGHMYFVSFCVTVLVYNIFLSRYWSNLETMFCSNNWKILGLGRYSPYRYNIDTEGNRYVSIPSSCRIDTQIWWLPQKWNNYSGKKVLVFLKHNLWTFIITYLFNENLVKTEYWNI